MRALVVYEPMYGNTHLIAGAITDGLRRRLETVVVSVGEADPSLIEGSDLVVVDGPTHAHGMSRDGTRRGGSKGIAHKLRRHGATLISEPESFLVTKDSDLEPNEEARARD